MTNRAEDLTCRVFGSFIVLYRKGSASDGSAIWRCRCACGKELSITATALRSGRRSGCRRCSDDRSWRPAEELRLRELYPTMALRALSNIFGRSTKAVSSHAKVLGLRKEVGHGGRRRWTEAEDAELRGSYRDTPTQQIAAKMQIPLHTVYHRAKRLGLHKSAEFIRGFCRIQPGQMLGKEYWYRKGQLPANKGIRRPGYAVGRMRETQFKKGQVSRNAMPMWSFRWCDGYLMLKTGAPTRKPTTGWEYVHKLIWEQANGPLPHWSLARIWWKDRDHGNCSLSNLELVTAQEHMARTTIHNFPSPLKEVIQLKGALKRRIGRMERNAEEHDGRSPQPPVCDDRSAAGR